VASIYLLIEAVLDPCMLWHDMSRPLMVVTDHGQTHSMYVPYAST